jgi:hypothetical protein
VTGWSPVMEVVSRDDLAADLAGRRLELLDGLGLLPARAGRPPARIASGCSRRRRLRRPGMAGAQTADMASEAANPSTTSGPVSTPSTT